MDAIAVIVPVYNTERYLERCLNSLSNQAFNLNYRVYIIDDGSTDSSAAIAKRFCSQYPGKYIYKYKSNGGQSSARNLGLDISESTYVAFVDSDDYVEEGYLNILYNLCVNNRTEISMCGMNRVSGDNGEGKRFDSGFNKDFVSADIDRILLTSSFAPCNKLFLRKTIGSLRFPEGMTYEDFALIPQVMNRAHKIAYDNHVLYHYYQNPDSTINAASKNKKANRNILAAQHILEESELKSKTAILENFYLRRVLSSLAWSLLEYHEDKRYVAALVDEGLRKYPNIKSNPYVTKESFAKRIFLNLILDKKIIGGGTGSICIA